MIESPLFAGLSLTYWTAFVVAYSDCSYLTQTLIECEEFCVQKDLFQDCNAFHFDNVFNKCIVANVTFWKVFKKSREYGKNTI